jgi:chromosome segregation ATPase
MSDNTREALLRQQELIDTLRARVSSLSSLSESIDGQINQFETERDRLQGELTRLQAELSQAETDKTTAETERDRLQGELTRLQAELSQAETDKTTAERNLNFSTERQNFLSNLSAEINGSGIDENTPIFYQGGVIMIDYTGWGGINYEMETPYDLQAL